MMLPNAEDAYIPPEKLTDYLLLETHAVGKSKAKFFRSHGYKTTIRSTYSTESYSPYSRIDKYNKTDEHKIDLQQSKHSTTNPA